MVNSTEPKSDGDKQKNTLDIGLLEEDDEFEEFPVEGKRFITFGFNLLVILFGIYIMFIIIYN